MRHISLMLVGFAAAAISISPAGAAMRIIADPGGAVIDYVERFEAARVSGEPVIIDGACLPACTLAIALLPRGQVCATPRAVLGFHAAHPPHYAPDQVVIIFGAPSGGAEMRVILEILAMIASVVVAAVATYFIVTFLLRFF